MDKLTEGGEKYRRILTYFLKKEGIYNDFVGNTKSRRQYYNGLFNQAVWEADGLFALFGYFFSFASAKYPKTLRQLDGTFKELDKFARFEFWNNKFREWDDFIYKREYEEITTLK